MLLVAENKSVIYRESEIYKQGLGSVLTLDAFFMSRGAIHSIPRLLTKNGDMIGGFPLTDLAELSLEKEEMLNDDLCYVIEGSHQIPQTTYYSSNPEDKKVGTYELAKIELWISKDDYTIRKIREVNKYKMVKEQVYNDIKLNGDIPDSLFDFSQ